MQPLHFALRVYINSFVIIFVVECVSLFNQSCIDLDYNHEFFHAFIVRIFREVHATFMRMRTMLNGCASRTRIVWACSSEYKKAEICTVMHDAMSN